MKSAYNEYKITYKNFRGNLARAVVMGRNEREAAVDFRRSVKGGPNADAMIMKIELEGK